MGILDDAIREHLELKRRHGVPEEEVERQQEEALGPARREVAQQPEDGEIAAEAGDDASLFDGEPRDAPVAEAPAVADDETAIVEPSAAEVAPTVEEPPAPSEHPLEQAEPAAAEALPTEAPPAESFPEEPPEAEAHTGMEPPPPELEPAEAEAAETPAAEQPHEPTGWEKAPPEPPAMETPPEPDPHEASPEPDPYAALGDTEPHGFPALEDDELPEDETHEAQADEDHEDDDSHDEPLPTSDPEDEELDVLEDTPDFLQETPEHDRLWFEQKPPRDFDFD